MREGVAFGVLAVVEMDQEGNPAVLFFAHLEWQHPVRHEAVKYKQLADFVGDPVPVGFGLNLDSVLFVKVVHFVGRIALQPNMQITAVIFFILGRSFNGNNTGVSARFYIKYTLRVLQQTLGIRVNII
jgi:hypothetical protein